VHRRRRLEMAAGRQGLSSRRWELAFSGPRRMRRIRRPASGLLGRFPLGRLQAGSGLGASLKPGLRAAARLGASRSNGLFAFRGRRRRPTVGGSTYTISADGQTGAAAIGCRRRKDAPRPATGLKTSVPGCRCRGALEPARRRR